MPVRSRRQILLRPTLSIRTLLARRSTYSRIFLLFLPRLIAWLQNNKRILPQVIDLWVLRCSLFLLLLGAILIGIAPNIPTLITGKHDMHVHYLANYPRSCTGLCHRFWMPYLDTCTCDLMGASKSSWSLLWRCPNIREHWAVDRRPNTPERLLQHLSSSIQLGSL
jgi:hypothetical protein